MPNKNLLIAVLAKLNENQLALGAAIEELTNWVEQRGSVETAENIRSALSIWYSDSLDLDLLRGRPGRAATATQGIRNGNANQIEQGFVRF